MMREFDAICPPPVREFSAADIKRLREGLKFSQPVFALHLHTTASTVRKWQQGETHPTRAGGETAQHHRRQGPSGNHLRHERGGSLFAVQTILTHCVA
jgi:hypothetical protein